MQPFVPATKGVASNLPPKTTKTVVQTTLTACGTYNESGHQPVEGSAQALSTCADGKDVLLKNASVFVLTGENQWVRAMLVPDDGSHKTFVEHDYANNHRLDIIGSENTAVQSFGSKDASPPELRHIRKNLIKGKAKSLPRNRDCDHHCHESFQHLRTCAIQGDGLG